MVVEENIYDQSNISGGGGFWLKINTELNQFFLPRKKFQLNQCHRKLLNWNILRRGEKPNENLTANVFYLLSFHFISIEVRLFRLFSLLHSSCVCANWNVYFFNTFKRNKNRFRYSNKWTIEIKFVCFFIKINRL